MSLIGVFHRPLPWPAGETLVLPQLYQAGIWAALVIGIGFTSVYAWRIASESARMSAGLAATQLALAREHRLASLGALATAAAHELGTPLGHHRGGGARAGAGACRKIPPKIEDVRLLRDQAERCRAIIARLANPEEAMLGAGGATASGRAARRYRRAASRRGSRHRRGSFPIAIADDPAAPGLAHARTCCTGWATSSRMPPISPTREVRIQATGTPNNLHVVIEDDGPGFAPEIFERIGEPYVTSRPGHHALGETEIGPRRVGRA